MQQLALDDDRYYRARGRRVYGRHYIVYAVSASQVASSPLLLLPCGRTRGLKDVGFRDRNREQRREDESIDGVPSLSIRLTGRDINRDLDIRNRIKAHAHRARARARE